jgi:transposase
MGLPIICIDARHANAALKMQTNKSDRNDAVGIARIMQCGRRETALHTLIHQRHLTPSCGGRAPTAERTLHPARMLTERLTPRPELEDDQDPNQTCR